MSSGNNGAGFPLHTCLRAGSLLTNQGEIMLQPFLQRGGWQCPSASQPLLVGLGGMWLPFVKFF